MKKERTFEPLFLCFVAFVTYKSWVTPKIMPASIAKPATTITNFFTKPPFLAGSGAVAAGVAGAASGASGTVTASGLVVGAAVTAGAGSGVWAGACGGVTGGVAACGVGADGALVDVC